MMNRGADESVPKSTIFHRIINDRVGDIFIGNVGQVCGRRYRKVKCMGVYEIRVILIDEVTVNWWDIESVRVLGGGISGSEGITVISPM
jgi:hypothetical protein